MGEWAFRVWQMPVVLVTISIDFFFAHQRLFLGLLFLLENFLHEVSLVHWGSNDFQVICVDDDLAKIYNRWGLEKWRMSMAIYQPSPNTGPQNLLNVPGNGGEELETG